MPKTVIFSFIYLRVLNRGLEIDVICPALYKLLVVYFLSYFSSVLSRRIRVFFAMLMRVAAVPEFPAGTVFLRGYPTGSVEEDEVAADGCGRVHEC